MGKAATLLTDMAANTIIRLVIVAVVMDTIFGVGRALKYRSFNSSVGIDGAIRKIAMVVSLVFLAVVDSMVHLNLIGFIPESVRNHMPDGIETIGLAEFFGLLYLGYEIVSVLKNMTLCGLPVKRLWEAVYKFLGKYTEELPDTAEQDAAEQDTQSEQAPAIAVATDDVPEGALEDNADGSVKVYDEDGNVVGSVTKEQAEALEAAVTTIKTD